MVEALQNQAKLPYPLKDLNQMIRDTIEVLNNEKGLIITLGYSALYYARDFYLRPLNENNVNFQLAKLYQSDQSLPEHREIMESSRPINPIGCGKAIIFDNSTRSFKSLAGAYKHVLPRCSDWGIHEVYAFTMFDENSGTNSTEVPLYQRNKIPYKGPLRVLRENSPTVFNELDKQEFGRSNKKLTELISTWASSVHQPGRFKKMVEKNEIGIKRMLFNAMYRPPKPKQNLPNT